MTNSEKEIEKGNERAGEEIIQVTQSKEKEKEVSTLIFSLNRSQSIITIIRVIALQIKD